MSVSDDRWGCPVCHAVVVVTGPQADVRAAITACQRRHADGHRRGQAVLARIDDNERDR